MYAHSSSRALLIDLYELTMAQNYLIEEMADRPSMVEVFVRRLPSGWGYFAADRRNLALDPG